MNLKPFIVSLLVCISQKALIADDPLYYPSKQTLHFSRTSPHADAGTADYPQPDWKPVPHRPAVRTEPFPDVPAAIRPKLFDQISDLIDRYYFPEDGIHLKPSRFLGPSLEELFSNLDSGSKLVTPEMDKTLRSSDTAAGMEKPADLQMYLPGDSGIAYLHASRFGSETTMEIVDALNQMVQKQLLLLVIDLRDCDGGSFYNVLDAASAFLPKDAELGGVLNFASRGFKTLSDGHCDFPVVILVNSKTSEGAEFFAAALQHNKRATVAGTTTAGKAALRSLIPLQGGYFLLLTTGYLVGPDGYPIENTGIQPDVFIDDVSSSSYAFSQAPSKTKYLAAENLSNDSMLQRTFEYAQWLLKHPKETPTVPGSYFHPES